jgi:hypothetical protein
MMAERKDDSGQTGLDAYFSAAAAETEAPSAALTALMARIEADALREMPRAGLRTDPVPELGAGAAQRPLAGRAGWRAGWREALAALGGWPALAGLAAASLVGVWIGAAPPDGLAPLLSPLGAGTLVLDETGVDPLSGFDLALLEG